MSASIKPAACLHCEELVLPGEQSPHHAQPFHWECGIRTAVGSVAHQQGRCSCYVPGSVEADPPGMTVRQAASAAASLFREQRRQRGMVVN